MTAPTASATLTRSGAVLTLTVTHSDLTVAFAIAGHVTNGNGEAAPFTASADFPGSVVIDDADGLTFTKNAAASTSTKSVYTAPLS